MPNRVLELNERQKLFFKARRRFIAYGGARGGGKTWAVREKADVLAHRYPGINILIVRRTYPELLQNHILPMQLELSGLAHWNDKQKRFIFPNGSNIWFGYCSAERDVLRYQGQEYDIIFIDEATQLTEYQFQTFKGCLRGVSGYPKRMYLTCNPGGVGHAWVKRLFIDRLYHTLTSNGVQLSSTNVQITGMVTFTDLSTSGRTTINGGNITTGIISAIDISSVTIDGSSISGSTFETVLTAYGVGGEIKCYYLSNISDTYLAGGLRLDDQGGSGDSTYRMFLYTRNALGVAFALKLESAGSMSLSSGNSLWMYAPSTVQITGSTIKMYGTVYVNDKVIS